MSTSSSIKGQYPVSVIVLFCFVSIQKRSLPSTLLLFEKFFEDTEKLLDFIDHSRVCRLLFF